MELYNCIRQAKQITTFMFIEENIDKNSLLDGLINLSQLIEAK